jgi:nicotinamide-nucleotide amidase
LPGDEATAWIITVGNEILIGRIVNTNASWLGEKLTFLGFKVERVITVPDNLDDIEEEVGRGIARARIVITTGGLGPTYDDMTLAGVARATGRRLILNKKAYEIVKEFYQKAGYELTEERTKMAMLPEGAEAVPNPVGAAPGSLLDLGSSIIISLPGVPAEMKAMFEQYVEPRLRKIAPHKAVVDCGFLVRGVPESGLAPWIKKASKLEDSIYLKSHPKGHETRGPVLEIRVLASGKSREEALTKALRVLEFVAERAKELGGETSEIDCKREGGANG